MRDVGMIGGGFIQEVGGIAPDVTPPSNLGTAKASSRAVMSPDMAILKVTDKVALEIVDGARSNRAYFRRAAHVLKNPAL
jgi:hypothetical protein